MIRRTWMLLAVALAIGAIALAATAIQGWTRVTIARLEAEDETLKAELKVRLRRARMWLEAHLGARVAPVPGEHALDVPLQLDPAGRPTFAAIVREGRRALGGHFRLVLIGEEHPERPPPWYVGAHPAMTAYAWTRCDRAMRDLEAAADGPLPAAREAAQRCDLEMRRWLGPRWPFSWRSLLESHRAERQAAAPE
jgi:hypothetical protein